MEKSLRRKIKANLKECQKKYDFKKELEGKKYQRKGKGNEYATQTKDAKLQNRKKMLKPQANKGKMQRL